MVCGSTERSKMAQVYIDATIPSYLVASQSSDIKIAKWQQITRKFWKDNRFEFILSDFVIDEIENGDGTEVAKRLQAVKELPRLIVSNSDRILAMELLNQKAIPQKAFIDAIHVAVAARNAVPYLATWNFKHLANPHTRPKIEQICRDAGYSPPYIDSPEMILETR